MNAKLTGKHGDFDADMGTDSRKVTWAGVASFKKKELDAAIKSGWLRRAAQEWGHKVERISPTEVRFSPKVNLVVDSGVQRSLDKLVGRNGPPGNVITMGVDNGAANPVAGTTSSTAGSTSRRLVSFDSTPTRTANVLSILGTFTQANVAFAMKRLFLSAAAAGTADAAGDLYSMTNVFTIDFTSFATWSLTFTATVTGAGS